MELKFDYEKTSKEQEEMIREIVLWAVSILGAILAAFLITRFALEKTTLSDSSMSTTLEKTAGKRIGIDGRRIRFSAF